MPWIPKIGRHVDYDNAGKLLPGTITAVAGDGLTVDIRITHTGRTFAGVAPGTGTGQYRPSSPNKGRNVASFLLKADGVSHLLKADGVSKLRKVG